MKAYPYLQSVTIAGEPEEDYLLEVPAVRNLRSFSFQAPVTIFAGENGSGKSTLLEALAVLCGFNPEGGTRNFNFSTKETHSSLYRCMRISRSIPFPSGGFFLRAESYYNVATEIDRLKDAAPGGEGFMRYYGGRSLHHQSHGESFLSLVMNRFGGNSLYILDEPEAALSPSRQFSLLARIHELAQEKAQFVIATHSPILMACPGAEVYVISEEGIRKTPYEETEHFSLMKHFVNNPEHVLHYLLNEEGD